MITVIDETGTRHQLEGTPAHIVATLCEGVRLLPAGGKYQVEFDCADADIVMRPRLSFRRMKGTSRQVDK